MGTRELLRTLQIHFRQSFTICSFSVTGFNHCPRAAALNADVFQFCALSHFLAANCLFVEQTIRSSKIRLYFWIRADLRPWVVYTWNRCRGSNARWGHTNMFAVTSLHRVTDSGRMEVCYVSFMMTVEVTVLAGMWRFGILWATCAVWPSGC